MFKEKSENRQKKTRSTHKGDRIFYAVLACATVLLSGFAATVVGLGSSFSTAHLPEDAPGNRLTLAQANPAPINSTPVVAETKASSITIVSQRQKEEAQTAEDLSLIEEKKDDAAQQAAKSALTLKLARLRLVQSLRQAQELSKAALEETPSPSISAFEVVAAFESVLPNTQEEKIDTAPANIVASLTTTLPETPQVAAPLPPSIKPTPPRRTNKPEDTPPVLAYARPGQLEEDNRGAFGKLFGGNKGLPGPRSKIAVYDISAATVYMPDGSKLVAHSGIGHRMDNPKYAYVKNLGPTPPNIYRLRMRERRFHGVEAIRMLPLDKAAMKGRDGMLTHTRLLRNSIGSHGCVAFKNYDKFLNAYKAGKVKTMIVVPSLKKLPTYLAKLNRSNGA